MKTFEQVLNVFSEYLAADPDFEVVMTSRGYTLLGWDNHTRNWATAEYCGTPESLCNALVCTYADYTEVKITGGNREATLEELEKIDVECERLKECCK